MRREEDIAFYLGQEHPCSYLEERVARSIFLDPERDPDRRLYSVLVDHGFRRSGRYVYRPNCGGCNACIPLRLPVARFQPSRRDRRTWKANRDLTVTAHEPAFSDERFDLYRRYQEARHRDGGMDDPRPEEFLRFLDAPWSPTRFHEFRLGGRLLAVAVTDHLEQGLSAVYTFFDPDEANRGLGNLAVLWQIEEARRTGLPFLYLGYWIAESAKMAYKSRFRPAETFLDDAWHPLDTPPDSAANAPSIG
ncbi:arginyltransferase [Endothiovibrio diazotrophicus]